MLDAVYRVAAVDASDAKHSEILINVLREFTSDANAKNKMQQTVTQIWLNLPEPAVGMIRWAIDHPDQFPDTASCRWVLCSPRRHSSTAW